MNMRDFVFKLAVQFLIVSCSRAAIACSAPTYPDLEDLEKYKKIYIAQVTAIDLTKFEKELLFEKRPKTNVLPKFEPFVNYSFKAVVSETVRGPELDVLEETILSCGAFLPQLRSTGIFFIEESNEVVPVYSNNGTMFVDALKIIEKIKH